jgi:two-component system, chemotaxis family, chemotaxis protein CheY
MANYKAVLIVDDSPTSRMIIQRCMEMSGTEIGKFIHAEDGIDALTMLDDNHDIDLVVSDINMPKMDGQTFIKLLRNKPETMKIPVIITSSIADGSVETEMNKLGITNIIKKPVSPEKIVHILGGIQ